MKVIAEHIPIQEPFPKRIYFVDFDFDDYPRVDIDEIKTAFRKAEYERKKARRKNGGKKEVESPNATCGGERLEVLSPHGALTVSCGERISPVVPPYGMDDLFSPINEPIKPVTKRARIDSHWGSSVWPLGGFQ